MSAPISLSPSLTVACSAVANPGYNAVVKSCGLNSGSNLGDLVNNTAATLSTVCSVGCKDSINIFARTANSTCGSEPIFADDKSSTVSTVVSQFYLVTAIGCVKQSNGAYCLVDQIATLSSAGLKPTSANLITQLTNYASKNASFTCTKCATDEVEAAKKLTTLNAEYIGYVDSVAQAQALICASNTPDQSKNSAVGLFVGSVLSFLPLFFL